MTEGDALVWQYGSKGIYTTQSLYAVINFRGVRPVFIPSVWKIQILPRVQVFLWLLSHNKLMTADNLIKRNIFKPLRCQFCNENESIPHLFFDCIAAKNIWDHVNGHLCIYIKSFEDKTFKMAL